MGLQQSVVTSLASPTVDTASAGATAMLPPLHSRALLVQTRSLVKGRSGRGTPSLPTKPQARKLLA